MRERLFSCPHSVIRADKVWSEKPSVLTKALNGRSEADAEEIDK